MSDFLTMQEYLDAAKRMLKKYNYGIGVNDEDSISYVAHFMMRADQKYDQSKCGEDGNRYGFRAQQGYYAITHLRKRYKNRKKTLSIHTTGDSRDRGIKDTSIMSPEDKLQCSEIMEIAKKILTERQLTCFTRYYIGNETLDTIGEDIGLTRQAVSLHVINSKNKIIKYMSKGQ